MINTEGNSNPPVEVIVIARVIKPRGIKGEVACEIETDFPERFATLDRVTVWMPDGSRIGRRIQQHWFHDGRIILKFEDVDDRTAAESLVGGRLVVSSADSMPLGEDEYYEHSIVGSQVVTAAGDGLGRVVRVMRTGGTDLLVVEATDGRERLIPFVDEICTEVDASGGRITVNPPAGLTELND